MNAFEKWKRLPLQRLNFDREPDFVAEILIAAKEVQRYAVEGKKVLIRAIDCTVLLETRQDVVWVDALHKCGTRYCFGIEKEVLRGLGLRLRALPSWRKEKFQKLFEEVMK